MAHFSEEAWSDFVRGIIHDHAASDIQKHLAEGCAECTKTRETWSQIRTLAAAESTYAVPEDVARMAKLYFQAKQQQAREWSLGKLVFDTFSQPAMAGVRSSGVQARQVVYEAEGVTVDLRFQRQPRSSKVCLTGQVLAKGAERSLREATVMIWTEKGEPIATTRTTGFGEFHLEVEPQEHLRLSIEAIGRRPIRIPLANLKQTES